MATAAFTQLTNKLEETKTNKKKKLVKGSKVESGMIVTVIRMYYWWTTVSYAWKRNHLKAFSTNIDSTLKSGRDVKFVADGSTMSVSKIKQERCCQMRTRRKKMITSVYIAATHLEQALHLSEAAVGGSEKQFNKIYKQLLHTNLCLFIVF